MRIELLRLGLKITVKPLSLLALESYLFFERIITRISLNNKLNGYIAVDGDAHVSEKLEILMTDF